MTENLYVISVIIPTYNRSPVLERCLAALSAQTFPRNLYEIIVADDGSVDDTQTVVSRWSAQGEPSVKYFRQPNRGANAARNQAILQAEGKLLLFINDDTLATSTMLAEHVRTHEQEPGENVAVLGRVTISGEIPRSLFAQLHLDADYALWTGRKELDWRAFYTCNVSVKKAFLMTHGLFEEGIRYHEDVELAERLSHHGLRVVYNPDALGYHYHYLEEAEYLGVGRREGTALAKWYRKAPHLGAELASIGFPGTASRMRRFKYFLADCLINPVTRPLILKLARSLADSHEKIARALYRKLFQSLKREGVRDELRK